MARHTCQVSVYPGGSPFRCWRGVIMDRRVTIHRQNFRINNNPNCNWEVRGSSSPLYPHPSPHLPKRLGLSSSPLQWAASISIHLACVSLMSYENQRSPEDTTTCKGQCISNIAAHIRDIKHRHQGNRRTRKEGRDAMCISDGRSSPHCCDVL